LFIQWKDKKYFDKDTNKYWRLKFEYAGPQTIKYVKQEVFIASI